MSSTECKAGFCAKLLEWKEYAGAAALEKELELSQSAADRPAAAAASAQEAQPRRQKEHEMQLAELLKRIDYEGVAALKKLFELSQSAADTPVAAAASAQEAKCRRQKKHALQMAQLLDRITRERLLS